MPITAVTYIDRALHAKGDKSLSALQMKIKYRQQKYLKITSWLDFPIYNRKWVYLGSKRDKATVQAG